MGETSDDQAYEEFIQRTLKRIEGQLRSVKTGRRSLAEIETEVDKTGDSIKEMITEEVIKELGSGYVGSRAQCQCGGRAKYKNRVSRQVIVLYGRLCYMRSYYYCRSCRSGFCPVDEWLELCSDDCSSRVKAIVARICSYLPFQRATDELCSLRGMHLSCTTVQRHAKEVGTRISDQWDKDLAGSDYAQSPGSAEAAARLYLAMDAAKCHVGGEWHDAKIGAAYHRDKRGMICNSSYYASLEKSHEFGHKMRTLARGAGLDQYSDVQFLGDGATWIWNEATKHFPNAIQSLDYYHGSEHIAKAAKFIHTEQRRSKAWVKKQKGLLLNDNVAMVINELGVWHP